MGIATMSASMTRKTSKRLFIEFTGFDPFERVYPSPLCIAVKNPLHITIRHEQKAYELFQREIVGLADIARAHASAKTPLS
jgi:hypothetical protein